MPKLSFTTPPPSLLAELREVATDASGLAAALAQANQLPDDFPAEQLQELLVELRSLSDGTAEGCRQPLEYARSRLPAIRRQFIRSEQPSDRPGEERDGPPPLTRGMLIDQRLGILVNSVTTALDEYRALASEREDDTDTAPSLTIDPAAPDAEAAMAASQEAEAGLGEQVEAVERIAEPDSGTADALQRQMRDARGLLHLARIELRMPGFVPRWYRKTIATVADYPRLLRKTAQAIQIGVDVARPLAEAWSNFEHGFKHLVLDSVEKAAEGLLRVADNWEAARDTAATGAARAEDGAEPEFDLAEAHAMILRGEAPPISWRPHIDQLDFPSEALTDLSPLAGLSALEHLDLDGTQVSDLSPMTGLSALRSLDLRGTRMSDLSPLAGLSALEYVNLNGTQVSDLSPLAGLSALRLLILSGTQVSDLSALAGLSTLEHLDLDDTQVSDLSPLTGLSALEHLDLDDTQVSDLSPLAGLSALEYLYLDSTQLSDLSPLAGLEHLRRVYVDGEHRDRLAATLGTRADIVVARPFVRSRPDRGTQ